jgi:putative transposase
VQARLGLVFSSFARFWSAPWKVVLPEVGFLSLWRMPGMPQRKHKPEEIVAKLRQVDVLLSQGRPVAEAIRSIGVTPFTYYRWRKEFGGLKSDQVKRLKDLEKENERLRKAVSDLTLEKLILREAASGNF